MSNLEGGQHGADPKTVNFNVTALSSTRSKQGKPGPPDAGLELASGGASVMTPGSCIDNLAASLNIVDRFPLLEAGLDDRDLPAPDLIAQHVLELRGALDEEFNSSTENKPEEREPTNITIHGEHAASGFHTYAKRSSPSRQGSVIDDPKDDVSRRIFSKANAMETILQISKGQKCISLGRGDHPLQASMHGMTMNLRYAICTEDLVDEFSQLKLENQDMDDWALICFHEPSTGDKTVKTVLDEESERIIQIIEDLQLSEHQPQTLNESNEDELHLQHLQSHKGIPLNSKPASTYGYVRRPVNYPNEKTTRYDITSQQSEELSDNCHNDHWQHKDISPHPPPRISEDAEQGTISVEFHLSSRAACLPEDLDIEIVDRDLEEGTSGTVSPFSSFPSSRGMSPILNSEDVNLVQACEGPLIPGMEDMRSMRELYEKLMICGDDLNTLGEQFSPIDHLHNSHLPGKPNCTSEWYNTTIESNTPLSEENIQLSNVLNMDTVGSKFTADCDADVTGTRSGMSVYGTIYESQYEHGKQEPLSYD